MINQLVKGTDRLLGRKGPVRPPSGAERVFAVLTGRPRRDQMLRIGSRGGLGTGRDRRKTGETTLVKILDSTLREGEQMPGVYFDQHIKLAAADLLDAVGVDFIEAGHPSVTREIHDAVKILANRGLRAKVAAHARSIQSDVEMALECGVSLIGVFYCVSDRRLDEVFRKDLDTAIEQISETIRFAKETDPSLMIRYTPEDTVRSEFRNVVEAASAAVRSGANIISIADTTGCMIPGTDRSMYDYVKRFRDALASSGLEPWIAVHCHNDRGLAVANALDAYRAGADIIDVSVLGIGERAGIVDLATLLAVLTEDFGETAWNLEALPELYELVAKYSGIETPPNLPVTGSNAFTHCAGVHTDAALKNPTHYESLNPALLGRTTRFALDHMSGSSSVRYALDMIGVTLDDDDMIADLVQTVKQVGKRGRCVDLSEFEAIVECCRAKQNHSSSTAPTQAEPKIPTCAPLRL